MDSFKQLMELYCSMETVQWAVFVHLFQFSSGGVCEDFPFEQDIKGVHKLKFITLDEAF